MGSPRGCCAEGTLGSFFHLKEDEYSLSGFRFQREQVKPSWRLSLLHSYISGGSGVGSGSLTVFDSPRNCPGLGSLDFYYVGECIMYLEVKSGSTSPPCWNQPALAGLLSLYRHSPSCRNSLCRICRM